MIDIQDIANKEINKINGNFDIEDREVLLHNEMKKKINNAGKRFSKEIEHILSCTAEGDANNIHDNISLLSSWLGSSVDNVIVVLKILCEKCGGAGD